MNNWWQHLYVAIKRFLEATDASNHDDRPRQHISLSTCFIPLHIPHVPIDVPQAWWSRVQIQSFLHYCTFSLKIHTGMALLFDVVSSSMIPQSSLFKTRTFWICSSLSSPSAPHLQVKQRGQLWWKIENKLQQLLSKCVIRRWDLASTTLISRQRFCKLQTLGGLMGSPASGLTSLLQPSQNPSVSGSA